MDPTLKRQNKPTSGHPTTARNPTQKPFYLSNPLSKLTHKAKKPPPTVDTQLQAKSLTVSADFEGLKLSTLKPKQHQQLKRVEPRLEKEVKVKKEEKKKEVKDVVDVKRMNVSIEGIGRRRSFCGSQIELADFLANNGAKIVAVDMPPFMQIHAVDCARKTHDSLEKFTSKTLALTLKKEFDGVYGPAWHCIVGTSFGSFVTHSVGGFLYFSIDQKLYVLLFKTSVQRAD